MGSGDGGGGGGDGGGGGWGWGGGGGVEICKKKLKTKRAISKMASAKINMQEYLFQVTRYGSRQVYIQASSASLVKLIL